MVTEAVKPMAGDVAGNDNGAVTDSRPLVDSLVASGALDPLFERIDGGRIELTCVLSSCYRPVWREFSFRKSGRF